MKIFYNCTTTDLMLTRISSNNRPNQAANTSGSSFPRYPISFHHSWAILKKNVLLQTWNMFYKIICTFFCCEFCLLFVRILEDRPPSLVSIVSWLLATSWEGTPSWIYFIKGGRSTIFFSLSKQTATTCWRNSKVMKVRGSRWRVTLCLLGQCLRSSSGATCPTSVRILFLFHLLKPVSRFYSWNRNNIPKF